MGSLSSATSQTCSFKSIVEYRRYSSDGQWIVFIVPAKLDRECLISFVDTVRLDMPGTRVELFDAAGPELDQYIRSAASGLNDSHSYPERWMKKHHVATLYAFGSGRGPSSCDWTLKFEKGDDALLGRGSCKTEATAPRVCKLTVDQSPSIRGFRLGQSRSELVDMIKQEYRGMLSSPDEVGVVEQTLVPRQFVNPSAFDGVETLRLVYIESRLWSVIAIYDSKTHWQSNLHFTAAVADSLGLTTKGWVEANPSRLDCDGFVVATYLVSGLVPSIMLIRTGLEEEKAARRDALEKKKRREFKP